MNHTHLDYSLWKPAAQATVNVVRLRSLRRLEWPISTSNSPGSTMRLASGSTIVQSATGMSNATVLVSPGSSSTRWNALSSRSVQLYEVTMSPIYACTTSVPLRSPVLVSVISACTVSVLVNVPESGTLVIVGSPYAKVV